mmetsp:Transcript_30814/g.69578  ORF Transcript_30814/g.69578 Transcript_30814/m.69578 type:complete len:280 (+) Transcript_30814:1496-2335(+)
MELHGWLGVRVVGRLETNVVKLRPEPPIKVRNRPHQMAEGQVLTDDETLHLVKLGEVGGVECLIAENTIDREVLLRLEGLPRLAHRLGELVKCSGGHGCGVRPEKVFARLLLRPIVPPPDRLGAVLFIECHTTVLVGRLHPLQVIHGHLERRSRGLDEKSVVLVPCRVLLGLEERIEIPEGRLDVLVRFHLLEPHFQENLPEHAADLEKRMQRTSVWWLASGIQIEWLEHLLTPRLLHNHLVRKVRDGLLSPAEEHLALRHFERLQLLAIYQLALLEVL